MGALKALCIYLLQLYLLTLYFYHVLLNIYLVITFD